MVEEYRSLQADIDSRRHFTEPKQTIQDTRSVLAEWLEPKPAESVEVTTARSAGSLRTAANSDEVEWG